MIIGAHAILYSQDADRDRRFLGETLGLKSVDVGGGWLIFALPPAEVAVHPTDEKVKHEIYLMCDDVEAFIGEMQAKNLTCSEIHDQPWGRLTELTLPGGGRLGVYEPRHASPMPRAGEASARRERGGGRGRSAGAGAGGKRKKTPKKKAASKSRSAVAKKKGKSGRAGRRS